MNIWKCPRCGKLTKSYPALSRKDNKTKICSDCGTDEALYDFVSFFSASKTESDSTSLHNFQQKLSDKREKCNRCTTTLKYSPGAPGYVYSNGVKQYCPKCMTAVNDAAVRKEDSISRYRKNKKFLDEF
jgi:predicted RNA-binding Zn-ribbon protein involved in translation (DUF1610 family)